MLSSNEIPLRSETKGNPLLKSWPSPSARAEIVPLVLWVVVAAAAFHAAYFAAATSPLMALYLFALLQLAQGARSWRKAFYPALAVGLLVAAGRLEFFWRIFSGGAIVLWLVYAFWVGLFTALARLCLRLPRHRFPWGWGLIPFLWCGLEYFRSELYYLRFAWLSPGFAFGPQFAYAPLSCFGTYGLGFLLTTLACAAAFFWPKSPARSLLVLALGLGLLRLWPAGLTPVVGRPTARLLRVAGVQMEFPSENDVLERLNELLRKYPDTELCVLSEYTFLEPVPERVKDWCRQHQRYLIVGGEDPTAHNYFNSAFVISPKGEVVFRQAKSVPIQFYKDGLPAPEQKVWDSPWGKIGLCICYDLSFSRVTDRLIRLGAQALIVPTMDVVDWGERQHQLHARVAPLRAAEYQVPIFRLASSGISQAVDRHGRVLASTTCPGDGEMLAATLELGAGGSLPSDRWLAPVATGLTGLVIVGLALGSWRKP